MKCSLSSFIPISMQLLSIFFVIILRFKFRRELNYSFLVLLWFITTCIFGMIKLINLCGGCVVQRYKHSLWKVYSHIKTAWPPHEYLTIYSHNWWVPPVLSHDGGSLGLGSQKFTYMLTMNLFWTSSWSPQSTEERGTTF